MLRRYRMASEDVAAALEVLQQRWTEFYDASVVLTTRVAEKQQADASLALATTVLQAADTAAEAALAALVAELAKVGIQ
jgi:hypothetical protein